MGNDSYKAQTMDLTKLALEFLAKIWIPIIACLGGALLGALVYSVQYRITNGPLYQTQSKVYLDFAADETGEVYQFYNGYTWNDLMSTEPILSVTMDNLKNAGVSEAEVEASTKAEILSDIRLLTITITNQNADVCESIKEATEKSLETLGSTAKEFRSIKVVKTENPVRIYSDNRIKQALLLGAVLGLFIAVMVMLFAFALDDRIMVPADFTGNVDAAFLGIEFEKKENEKADAEEDALEKRFEADLLSNCSHIFGERSKAITLDAYAATAGKEPMDYEMLRAAEYVILQVPYKKVTLRTLSYLLSELKLQDCEKVGIILTDADRKMYHRYFRWG